MRYAEQPVGETEGESNGQDVAGALERDQPAAQRVGLTALQALHLKSRGHSRHQQKQRRRHAPDELGEHIRSALAQIQTRERIKGVALDHDDYGQSTHPVQERKSFHLENPAARLDST